MKISQVKLSSQILNLLLEPFVVVLVRSEELPLRKRTKTNIFVRLLDTLSNSDFVPENEVDEIIHPKLSLDIDFASISAKLLEYASTA